MLLPGIYQYNDFFSGSKTNSATGLTRSVRHVFGAILRKYQSQDVRSVRNYSIPAFRIQSVQQSEPQKPSKQLQLAAPTSQRPKAKRSRPRSQHGKPSKLVEIKAVEITPPPESPRYKTHPRRHHSRKHTSKETTLKLQKPRSREVFLQSPKVQPKSPETLPPLPSSFTHHLITPTPQLPTCTTCAHTPCRTCEPAQMRKCCVCHRISRLEEEICAKCYHLGNDCIYCEGDFHAFVGCCRCAGSNSEGGDSRDGAGEFSFGREVCWECDVLGCDGRCESGTVDGGVMLE